MKLIRFRVNKFRSIEESDWIETGEVTAFIGTNESGKTNLLVPLWKLNPAKDGEINPIQDYPRDQYHIIREMKNKPIFIDAEFELSSDLSVKISALTNRPMNELDKVIISRDYDGNYYFNFPNALKKEYIDTSIVENIVKETETEIAQINGTSTEETLKKAVLERLNSIKGQLNGFPNKIDADSIRKIKDILDTVDTSKAPKRSMVATRYGQAIDSIEEIISEFEKPAPSEVQGIWEIIYESMPKFVYYSNYGNLDSEIYLPHVIQNLNRSDLGVKEAAKARTLRVLFDFVKLKPQEILELGRDFRSPDGRQPTQAEIEEIAEKKKERDILLQSASTELTNKFRGWWKQGDYRFRFQADGDHFRIWVSDDKRPEDIELEGRSTGLQWFLSFYLVFLVESTGSHKNAILLLDEPGLSLHPIAQRNLSEFFESLSETNQILYTTHSPFMVDPDHLDRVKAVYINEKGSTSVSSDLRAAEGQVAQSQSIYPVYATLGLTVSDTLLQGCQPIIVEGTSDQYYLSAIKNYLIGKSLVSPKRELVFIPAGGVKGISAVTSILTGKEESLPFVILDGDNSGRGLAKKLKEGLYQGEQNRVLLISDLIGLAEAEIEDLFPHSFLAYVVTRYLPRPAGLEEEFRDVVQEGKPIVPQIEEYAQKNGIKLQQPGWKVEVAKLAKNILFKGKDSVESHQKNIDNWKKLFAIIQN